MFIHWGNKLRVPPNAVRVVWMGKEPSCEVSSYGSLYLMCQCASSILKIKTTDHRYICCQVVVQGQKRLNFVCCFILFGEFPPLMSMKNFPPCIRMLCNHTGMSSIIKQNSGLLCYGTPSTAFLHHWHSVDGGSTMVATDQYLMTLHYVCIRSPDTCNVPKCVKIFCHRAGRCKPFLCKLVLGLAQWLRAFLGN